jgi:hypothetical protein
MIFFLKKMPKVKLYGQLRIELFKWIVFFLNERLNNQSLVKNGNLFFFSKRTLPT